MSASRPGETRLGVAPIIFLVAATTFATACLSASPARASATDLFGPGPRAAALGGTGVSFSDDWEATWENPAGLAMGRARRLTVGFLAARYDVVLDGSAHPVEATNGLFLGVKLPIPLGGVLADRIVLGLAFYVPSGVVNRARSPFPDVPRLAVLDDRTQSVSLTLSAGARLTRTLSVGVGVIALAALVGEIDLLADTGGHFGTSSEEQLIASYAPVAGVRWNPSPRWQLGLVFRGESLSRFDIRVKSDLSAVLPFFALPTLRISGVSQYDPMQMAAEGSLRPSPAWLLAAGVGWARWSAFPAVVDPATQIPDPPPPGFTPPAPPGFHDTVVPRAGAEWSHASPTTHGTLHTTLRAGYFFAESPAPDTAAQKQVDAHRHVLTAGAEIAFDNRFAPLRAALFFQWHQLQPTGRASGWLAVTGFSLGIDL